MALYSRMLCDESSIESRQSLTWILIGLTLF